MRQALSTALLLLGACLLALSIGSGMAAHGNAVSALGAALPNKSAEQAGALDEYFERAKAIALITAHNPAFGDFYRLPGTVAERTLHGGPALDRANHALKYLQELYPDSIGEACFIDARGAEIARATRGERAPLADLSPDETGAPFFKPTFDQPIGEVYHSAPYVSPDTEEWVVANSTVIPSADAAKRALVHYEISIESFRKAASARSQFDIAVVDAHRRGRDRRPPRAAQGRKVRPARRPALHTADQADHQQRQPAGQRPTGALPASRGPERQCQRLDRRRGRAHADRTAVRHRDPAIPSRHARHRAAGRRPGRPAQPAPRAAAGR